MNCISFVAFRTLYISSMTMVTPSTTNFSDSVTRKWSSAPKSIEEITELLKEQGSRLDELNLLWREPRTKNDSVGLLTKKNVAGLEKALKKTRSRINQLSIGWKHGGDRKSLIRLLQLFMNLAEEPSLQPVDSIELVLASWVPDAVLLQLLTPYASRLKCLHIQATRMKVRTIKQHTLEFKNIYQSVHAVGDVLEEESVASIFGIPELANSLTLLTSLSLKDCDVLDEDIDVLGKFLWRRAGTVGTGAIKHLSLRGNRHMGAAALRKIAQAPVSHSLDMSLCDIGDSGANALALAFAPDNPSGWRQRHGIRLEELVLSGNYQIDEHGFTRLCRIIPNQVQRWIMSYCDITDHQSLVILQELVAPLSSPTCLLKELTIQGLKIGNQEACETIRSILQSNRSLTKLCVDDPKYPTFVSTPKLKVILEGLKEHYSLKVFELDRRRWKAHDFLSQETKLTVEWQVYDAFEFYLLLNRAGRKILQNSDEFDKRAWVRVLCQARLYKRLDVVYWLLSNSVITLFDGDRLYSRYAEV